MVLVFSVESEFFYDLRYSVCGSLYIYTFCRFHLHKCAEIADAIQSDAGVPINENLAYLVDIDNGVVPKAA